jgi:hypothetical protein
MAIIDNVTFFYVKIQSPVPAFIKTNSEYTVECVVDKATAKAFGKQFQKQKPKEVDNEDFLDKYKVKELPFPDQDEQFVISLKKGHIKDGKASPEKYRPRVLEVTEDGNEDITFDKLVANGSTGKVSYRVNENDYGTFAELQAILVEDLIEYKGGSVTSDFGAVKLKDVPADQKVKQKQSDDKAADEAPDEPAKPAATSAKPAKPKKPVAKTDDEENKSPF